MKLAYSFTADIHAVNAEGELTYMLTQDVPFEGEINFTEIKPDELARLGPDGVLEWLDDNQKDGVDDAFWDCFGSAIRRRYPYVGDCFSVEYRVLETA